MRVETHVDSHVISEQVTGICNRFMQAHVDSNSELSTIHQYQSCLLYCFTDRSDFTIPIQTPDKLPRVGILLLRSLVLNLDSNDVSDSLILSASSHGSKGTRSRIRWCSLPLATVSC